MDSFWFSLCESFAPAELETVEESKRKIAVNDVAQFVEGQLSSLPLSLRFCLALGLAFFRIFILVTTLRPFERHDLNSRRRICTSWAYGPIGVARQLFKPIRALAIFAYYESPSALGCLSEAEAQKRKVEEGNDRQGAMVQSSILPKGQI